MQFILCGLAGWIAEILFKGITDPIRSRGFSFRATTSLWVFPIYGLICFLYPPLRDVTRNYDWYIRGSIYMFAFYVVEYTSGWILLKMTGDYVWQYSSRFNLGGFVQFAHAPVWFFAGLGLEKLYPYIVRLSGILA